MFYESGGVVNYGYQLLRFIAAGIYLLNISIWIENNEFDYFIVAACFRYCCINKEIFV